jgi:hypothetical protein
VSQNEYEQKVEALLEKGDRSLYDSMSSLGYLLRVERPILDKVFEVTQNAELSSRSSIVIEMTAKRKFFLELTNSDGKNTEFLGERLKDRELEKLIADRIIRNNLVFAVAAKFYFNIPDQSSVAVKNYFTRLTLSLEPNLVSGVEKLLREQSPRFEKLRTFFINPLAPGHKLKFKELIKAINLGEARNLPVEFLADKATA